MGKVSVELPDSGSKRGRLVREAIRCFGWHRQKFVVNALDLQANMPPIEVGQDCGSRVGSQLGREFSIVQQGHNSAAQALAIMIGNNECIMQMIDTLGAAGERNDRFSGKHIIQQLHRVTGAFGTGHDTNIREREEAG